MASAEVNGRISEESDAAEMPAAEIDEAYVPRHRDNVAGVELDGETVLLIEGTTRTHWLNQTATIVWNCLDGTVSLSELAGEIAEAFGAEEAAVRSDIVDIVRGMGRAGLLDGVAEEIPQPQQAAPPPSIPVGDELPAFEGRDLEGATVRSTDLRGRKLFLVNWSPSCGFCRRIAPDLAEVQADLKVQGVDLVLLTFGTAEDNRELLSEHGVDGTVVLHEGSDAFPGVGTPAAYLVDEDGNVASQMALGAIDVPILARSTAGRDDSES
jgi:thiol-disulfide isomerase/thioredoxin